MPSGTLGVTGLLNEVSCAARLQVPAGRMRALVTFESLSSLSQDGLDGGGRSTVCLWLESSRPDIVVLRRWRLS